MCPRDDADDADRRDDAGAQPTDEELAARLDELEATLRNLRAELRDGEGERTRDRGNQSRRGPPTTSPLPRPPKPPGLPRPPRISELLRFTEEYTIPTLIAVLETTITSLELLRGTLRLVDPERDLRESADDARSTGGVLGRAATDATREGLAGVRSEAERGLARSLAELRRALDDADLPEDAASRSILEDARDLSAEIEARIREERERGTERGTGGERGGTASSRDADAVSIDVRDPDEAADGDAGDASADAAEDAESDDRPTVDVESELESIKDELDRRKADREVGSAGGSGGGDGEGETADGDGKGDADGSDRKSDADGSDRKGGADDADRKE